MLSSMHGSPDKIAKLEELARLRQNPAWDGYRNIGDFHCGIYDSLHVSPYTRGAGNCDSPVFLLLQDWCSAKFLQDLTEEQRKSVADLGRASWLPINQNLTALLERHVGMTLEQCYATNLFPFIKPSAEMTAAIEREDLRRVAREFAIPQIRIVQPKQVICLGSEVFRSVRHALGLTLALGSGSQVGKCFPWEGIHIWCQVSPGALGCANRGGLDKLHDDWAQMVSDPRFNL